ncbi:MAG: OmpA family protein [Salinivirgaceae bacterium]
MRILLTGFLVFCLWAWLATWWYVNKIKTGIDIPEATAMQVEPPAKDTLVAAVPEKLPLTEEITRTELTHFDFDKAVLKSKTELELYLNKVKPYLEEEATRYLDIIGHTDAVGPQAYNQKLGLLRAQAVQAWFESQGLAPERLKVSSKGETQPVADNATSKGRADNRRAEITLK